MNNSPKYQKGDKVIILNLDYFDNPYHFEKSIQELTVLDSDDKYFSPYYKEYDKSLSGSSQWSIFHQSNGYPIYGNERILHKIKDADEIKSEIAKALKKYDDKCIQNDINEIAKLLHEIERAKKQIEEIRKGNGSWKIGFTSYNNKNYREKVKSFIDKIFPIN